jgi:hypothetical protein
MYLCRYITVFMSEAKILYMCKHIEHGLARGASNLLVVYNRAGRESQTPDCPRRA